MNRNRILVAASWVLLGASVPAWVILPLSCPLPLIVFGAAVLCQVLA